LVPSLTGLAPFQIVFVVAEALGFLVEAVEPPCSPLSR